MCEHTALADLPTILAEAGVNVIVADGYLGGQCKGTDHYRWTDPDTGTASHDLPPHGYMIHHTAGSSATPPPALTSKAGAWAGMYRNGKLYPTGDGVPTIYLASAGPARVSSGYGYRPAAWDYTFEGRRAPAHAEGPDGTTALNRYVFNIEIVHPGDGGALDKGVWDAVVTLGQVLEDMFGMVESSLGHTSWSQRKIDPKLSVGLPNDGANCIIDFQDGIATEGECGMPKQQWDQFIDALFETPYFVGDPNYWKNLDPDSAEWVDFWNAFVNILEGQ